MYTLYNIDQMAYSKQKYKSNIFKVFLFKLKINNSNTPYFSNKNKSKHATYSFPKFA